MLKQLQNVRRMGALDGCEVSDLKAPRSAADVDAFGPNPVGRHIIVDSGVDHASARDPNNLQGKAAVRQIG